MLVKIQVHLQQDQVIVSLNLLQHLHHHHQSQPMIQTDLIIPVRADLYEMFLLIWQIFLSRSSSRAAYLRWWHTCNQETKIRLGLCWSWLWLELMREIEKIHSLTETSCEIWKFNGWLLHSYYEICINLLWCYYIYPDTKYLKIKNLMLFKSKIFCQMLKDSQDDVILIICNISDQIKIEKNVTNFFETHINISEKLKD